VVFDLTGAFVESFYDPRRDYILNLNDERCQHWSVFHDCAHDGEFLAAAEALIPDVDGADGGFWERPRAPSSSRCARSSRRGQGHQPAPHPRADDLDARRDLRPAQGHHRRPADPKAERMANSVRGVFNAHAKALMFLPDEGESFSIKAWAARRAASPRSCS
jgi:hypothetical protein